MWQVGENKIMSGGALALAWAAQLMELIHSCFSHGQVSQLLGGGTGAKPYKKMMALPQSFFKSYCCVLSMFLTLFKGH